MCDLACPSLSVCPLHAGSPLSASASYNATWTEMGLKDGAWINVVLVCWTEFSPVVVEVLMSNTPRVLWGRPLGQLTADRLSLDPFLKPHRRCSCSCAEPISHFPPWLTSCWFSVFDWKNPALSTATRHKAEGRSECVLIWPELRGERGNIGDVKHND